MISNVRHLADEQTSVIIVYAQRIPKANKLSILLSLRYKWEFIIYIYIKWFITNIFVVDI